MSAKHSHTHRSPPQPDHPEPSSHYELLGVALNELLIEKGVYTAEEGLLVHILAAVGFAGLGAFIIGRGGGLRLGGVFVFPSLCGKFPS